MKRALIGGTLVLLVMASAVALAATRSYSGGLENGGKVNLDVEFKRGDPIKILPGSGFRRLPMRCDEGRKLKIKYFLPEIKVSAQGRFRYSNFINDYSHKFVGRFVGNEKVTGRFRYEGPIFAGTMRGPPTIYTNCDTGKVRWTAKR